MIDKNQILRKPFTKTELQDRTDETITAYIAVPFSEIIDSSLEEFLDICSEKVIGNPCLMDIQYQPVGIENETSLDPNIILKITGYIEMEKE